MPYEYQTYLKDVCIDFGVPYVEVDDPVTGAPWQSHAARGPAERDYVPYMLVNHHTASVNNYPDPPWYPVDRLRTKCNINIKPDGTAYLISAGYQYDTGYGDQDVLEAMVAGVEPPYPPTDTYTSGGVPGGSNPGVLFNPWAIDIECDHPGDGRDITDAQWDSLTRINAGILLHNGWDVHRLIGHGETTRRKIDPYWNDMRVRNNMNLIRFETQKLMEMYMNTFADVPSDYLFHDDIEWAYDNKITKVRPDPDDGLLYYRPDDPTTRGEMAAFLYRSWKKTMADVEALLGGSN